MRRSRGLSVLLLVLLLLTYAGNTAEIRVNSLYQVSTLQSLLSGQYDGVVSVEELLSHGGMGLGTLDRLDGEMIVWDGAAYQGRVDGKIYKVGAEMTVPFANVAFRGGDKPLEASFEDGYEGLQSLLNKLFPDVNKPVLFCITGHFKGLSYRSVPVQSKPYPTLMEVVKDQAVFTEDEIDGMLVGFRFPGYMTGFNVKGFHMHFLSRDKTRGGHLFGVDSGVIAVDATLLNEFEVFLPDTISGADLGGVDAHKAAEAVEKLKTE